MEASPLSPREAAALRRSLVQRITAAEENRYRREELVGWLERVPDASLAQEARVAQAALADPRTRAECLFALRTLARHREPRLTPALRAALIDRISRREITDGVMHRMVQELLDADEETYARRAAELLAPPSKPSFAGAHTVLVHALRAAPEEALPPGPFHRGEPRPNIGARGYALLGITLARTVARDLTELERELCNRLTGEVLAVVEGGPAAGAGLEPPQLEHAPGSRSALTLSLLGSALREARISHRRPDAAGTSMRSVVARTVRWLAGDGAEAVRSFLVTVDEELRRLDVVHALFQRKKQPQSPVVRALWRGAAGGKVALWLALLEDGQHGLLSKIGRRWSWTEGSRDDVLATVPDDRFEEAVMAAVVD
jgi:hypothetical protein